MQLFFKLFFRTCIIYTLCFFIPAQLFAQSGNISGTVLDKYTQKPLDGVTISVPGLTKGTLSDSSGQFEIRNLALKTYNIEFSRVGYRQHTLYNVIINAGNEINLNVEMESMMNSLQEVTVSPNKRSARVATLESPLSIHKLTSEEIIRNPGGNFDISKVIQSLPGVGGGALGGSFRNDIIIRGGAPNENVYYLDGVEIPVINHFQTQGSSGGPQGILNVSFIEDVKFSSSAFDAQYSNALSSIFQFKERNGNPNRVQGNIRLSASEFAATLEGPLAKDKKTTFLVSARRSYLQLLFSLLDLPLRPNYWDFQTKITHRFDEKTTLSFIGIGAIDKFSFAPVRKSSPENAYILNSNPLIEQWTYTAGFTLKRLIRNGYINLALSRNVFNNQLLKYEDNQTQMPDELTLSLNSRETENKLRIDVNQVNRGWKLSYGADLQLVDYANTTFELYRKELKDSSGGIIQSGNSVYFTSPLGNFWRYGGFVQVGKRFFENKLGISAGIRSDMNTLTLQGNNGLNTMSPRLSISYAVAEKWNISASVGRYYKIPPYTILGYADSLNQLVNQNSAYQRCDHYVAGVEYLPNDGLRFTAEAFYKAYDNVPVSLQTGISLANLGTDFTALGNEAIVTAGKGKAYGFELFAQKKLTDRFFGILSFTYYWSYYSGLSGVYLPSTWDNRQLLSATIGYKLPKNWEIGLKFRFQGHAPYSLYDSAASRANYLSRGQGIFDYARLNSLRLPSYNSSDIRIDKKWNFSRTTLDLFLDVTNWYVASNQGVPNYTFKRTTDNKGFETTDGQPIRPDGSNAIPYELQNIDNTFTPTIGFIFEF